VLPPGTRFQERPATGTALLFYPGLGSAGAFAAACAAMRARLALLLASLLLAACSTLSLGYGQLPRLASWWIDSYLDLDRAQDAQLDAALEQLIAWHRREELPRWQALLRRADGLWADGGVTEAKLLQLEREAGESIERTLAQAAPLATPLLAGLRPEQWQRLQRKLAERLEEWRERQQQGNAAERRGKRFADGLERWLGDVERPLRRMARHEAEQWPGDPEALAREWAARQQMTLQGLQAWARGEHAAGTRLLVQAGGRDTAQLGPAETARRRAVLASTLRLLQAASPAQQAEARAHWARWQSDLTKLHTQR
jgi:hypothetical protein